MHKSKEYSKSKEANYVSLVVEQQKALNIPKRPPSTTQVASMQATIDRDPSKDAEHWNRKIDMSVAIAPHPSTCERIIDPDQYSHIEAIRRRPKNSIGQSEKSSASEERKEIARQAFTCSQPADLNPAEKEKLTELNKIEEYVGPFIEPQKNSIFKRIIKLFGQSEEGKSLIEVLKELNKEKK